MSSRGSFTLRSMLNDKIAALLISQTAYLFNVDVNWKNCLFWPFARSDQARCTGDSVYFKPDIEFFVALFFFSVT